MKRSKIILTIIFTAAALVVLYFAYGAVKNRYFAPTPPQSSPRAGEEATNNQTFDQSAGNQENNVPENTAPATENGQPIFENADCASDCARFKKIPDGLKYCQEACGERPVTPKESEGQCENLAGLEKDACWRDLAVSKMDIDICGKISDAKLQKVCRNRVTEEVLN